MTEISCQMSPLMDRVNVEIKEELLLFFLGLRHKKTMQATEKRLRRELRDDSVILSQSKLVGSYSIQLDKKLLAGFLDKLQAKKDCHPWSTENELQKKEIQHLKAELAEAKQASQTDQVQFLEAQVTALCEVPQNASSSDCDCLRKQLATDSYIEMLEEYLHYDREAFHSLHMDSWKRDNEWVAVLEGMKAEHEAQRQASSAEIDALKADLKASHHLWQQLQQEKNSLIQELETSRSQQVEEIGAISLEMNTAKNALKELQRRWEEKEQKSSLLQETNVQPREEQDLQEKEASSTPQLNLKERSSSCNEADLQENKENCVTEQGPHLENEEELEHTDKTDMEDLQSPVPEQKPQKKKKWYRRLLARLK
ncbi:sarcolemmal membrane-associated protein-like [Brachionichthys hirsutus]|uniref:sarcolemmal membrane-associated protein-like n=1 Tax=Brachionichthys hirsutus TaxID=412623 RepID=UPI0036045DEB